MKTLKYFLEFLLIFAVAFVTCAVVTYLYNIIFHAQANVNWDTAVQLGIILGIVIPWVKRIENRVSGK
jgi:hypothetical protein